MAIKVSVVAPSQAAVLSMTREFISVRGTGEVQSAVGNIDAVCAELLEGRPDILVAEVSAPGEVDFQKLGGSTNAQSSTAVILVTADRSPETLLKAMRAGVREVVHLPLANGELKEAYGRQLERLSAQQQTSRGDGQIIGFLPAKGGSGATFLATSFAHALSQKGKRVAVIDLNLHLGDAAIFVSDQPVSATMADIARQEQRLDGNVLESSLLKCATNLWLLAAPETLEGAVSVKPETVSRVLTLAASRFDYVVLDLPRVPDAVTMAALEQAKRVYLITQATLPFLHDGKRLLEGLRDLGFDLDVVELVINRVEKGGDLSPADVRKALQFEKAREIPNSYAAVAYAINHGMPIVRHAPKDPVSKALIQWAAEWVPEDRLPRASGWLRGFAKAR